MFAVLEKLRRRNVEGGSDAWGLAKRVAAGEDIDVDVIADAMARSKMTTEDFARACEVCRFRIDDHKLAADRSRLARELDAVRGKIDMQDEALRRAKRQHEDACEPLYGLASRAEDGLREAERAMRRLADTAPPAMRAAREAARRHLHEVSKPLHAAEAKRDRAAREAERLSKFPKTKLRPTDFVVGRSLRAAEFEAEQTREREIERLKQVVASCDSQIAKMRPAVESAQAALAKAESACMEF